MEFYEVVESNITEKHLLCQEIVIIYVIILYTQEVVMSILYYYNIGMILKY